MNRRTLTSWALRLGLAATGSAVAAVPLPGGIVDPAQVSVSGLSSGGFMAVQLHVAYSERFARGVGVVAGGPYNCAEGSLSNATGRCMTDTGSIPVAGLVATTRQRASGGAIDAVVNLANAKIYLFSGTSDGTVHPRATQALRSYYEDFVPAARIVVKDDLPAAHAMVTEDFGASCASQGSPFINDCDFDLAGRILEHLHGPLVPRNDGALAGQLIEFDQTPFGIGHGLGAQGWVYMPPGCDASRRCALHVALHGCRQNAAAVGDTFARHAGYNRWADVNRIVVLYPQTGTGAINGCWDWWGYDSADYAIKTGPQMKAVTAMVDRLAGSGGEEVCFTASNAQHYFADRATLFFGAAYARGSEEPLGWWFRTTTLKQTGPGEFRLGRCG